jgi:hypothetical protein
LSTAGKLKLELQLVARLNIPEEASPYYPPRARWYSRPFSFGSAIRRRLALDRIRLPREMALVGLVASFLVPGLAVYIRGPRPWGRAALAGCGLLLLLFIVWFGYPAGNLAFGLLLSIHITGFVYYCSPLLSEASFQSRLLFTLLTMMALSLLIYLPIRNVVLQHWLVPLRLNGHVFVAQRQFPAAAIQRGDWIAYKLGGGSSGWQTGGGHGTVYVRSGMGFGPVLAVAGDRVTFSTNVFTVNGIRHPLLPHMPRAGEVAVPEKNWFVWPGYSISGEGDENRITSQMLQLALVPENDFVGKPFQRWLWRRQITP